MGRNSVKKERKQNPKKKQEIIEGLIQFFKTNSLATANMDEIALALNRSKATLYKYYKSKEQMVDDLVNYKVQEIAKFAIILHDDKIPFVDRYEQSFLLLGNEIEDISIDFIEDLKNVFPIIFNKIELLINLAVKELAAYYNEGMNKVFFNNLNATLLSHNDFIVFKALIDPEFLRSNNITMQQAFKDFYDIRCKGLLA